VRALPVAFTLTDRACARKHDTDLGNRLTDQAFGFLGRDAVLTITGPRNAGKLPDCGAPAREQVIDPFGLTGPARIVRESGGARGRVMAWPAAGYGVLAAGGLRGEEDEQA
jgi:hypothetical protein